MVSNVPHEHIMFIHITSPLIKIQTLNECIKLYKKFYGEYDSLATVTAMHKFMWYKDKAVNYDPSKIESYDIDNPIEFKIAEKIFLMENE